MKNEQCLPASTRVKVKKYASMHVEKLARAGALSVVWAPVAGLFSSLAPCNGGVCPRSAEQGLMQEALPPAFRIAKFVTDLVTLPEKIVR
jgi:hypothetical protein